jgi:WD40 repeat protein
MPTTNSTTWADFSTNFVNKWSENMFLLGLLVACAPLPEVAKRDFAHKDAIRSLAWSPDGFVLFVGTAAGEILFWDAKTGRKKATLKAYKRGMGPLSVRGNLLASIHPLGTVKLWDWKKATLQSEFPTASSVESMCLHPDGKSVALIADEAVHRWDVAGKKPLPPLEAGGLKELPDAIGYSPDGKRLLLTATETLNTGAVQTCFHLYDSASDEIRRSAWMDRLMPDRRLIHAGHVAHLAWSADSQSWAVAAVESIFIYDDKKTVKITKSNSNLVGLAFTSDGKHLVSVERDGAVRVYDRLTGKETAKQEGWGKTLAFALHPHERSIAIALSDKRVLVRPLPSKGKP